MPKTEYISRGGRGGGMLFKLYEDLRQENLVLKAKLERYESIVECGKCRFCTFNKKTGNYHCTTYDGMKRPVMPHDFCSHREIYAGE